MKVGVLGLGFMGSTHLKGWVNIPAAEVVAVMDLDETRLSGDLSGIQGNLGGPGLRMDFSQLRRYRSVDEILADPEIEAVDICLPTNQHAPAAVKALRAGKHVIVEKPMALDGASADEMLVEERRSGRVLMVAQVLRFLPPYTVLSELVKSGRLGTIRSAFLRRRTAAPTWGPWQFDRNQGGGGIFDLLIHDVDLSLHLFGIPDAVSSTGHEDIPNGVDVISSQFHYPVIGDVTLNGGWYHIGKYPFSMEYTVVGDQGTVEFSSAGRPVTIYWSDGREEMPELAEIDSYQAELEYFVECCRTNSRAMRCLPEESATSVKLTRLMVDAREQKGGKVICRF